MSDLYEADFWYCNTCKHGALSEGKFPCIKCIIVPACEGTCKPANWEAHEKLILAKEVSVL